MTRDHCSFFTFIPLDEYSTFEYIDGSQYIIHTDNFHNFTFNVGRVNYRAQCNCIKPEWRRKKEGRRRREGREPVGLANSGGWRSNLRSIDRFKVEVNQGEGVTCGVRRFWGREGETRGVPRFWG